jgi:hypothetical protein
MKRTFSEQLEAALVETIQDLLSEAGYPVSQQAHLPVAKRASAANRVGYDGYKPKADTMHADIKQQGGLKSGLEAKRERETAVLKIKKHEHDIADTRQMIAKAKKEGRSTKGYEKDLVTFAKGIERLKKHLATADDRLKKQGAKHKPHLPESER